MNNNKVKKAMIPYTYINNDFNKAKSINNDFYLLVINHFCKLINNDKDAIIAISFLVS